jgi:hypothetical protein
MRESASVIVRLVAEGWMHSSKAPHSTITLESSARWAGALVFTTLLIAIGCSSVRTTDAASRKKKAPFQHHR